jgi:hypothetical protein
MVYKRENGLKFTAKILTSIHLRQRRDSSVGIALGYGLEDWGSRVRFPVGAGNFSLHPGNAVLVGASFLVSGSCERNCSLQRRAHVHIYEANTSGFIW